MITTYPAVVVSEGRVLDWSLIKGWIRKGGIRQEKVRREQHKRILVDTKHSNEEYQKDLDSGREVLHIYLQSTFMS